MERIKHFVVNHKYLLLLIAISLFFLFPLLHPEFIVGHDNRPQVARIASRIIAIQDGHFPIRWSGNLNYGYGHPGFIFFYSLSGYFGSLLYFLGFTLEHSYEILLGLTFILAPVFFYLWASMLFSRRIAFVTALLYGLAPYSFLDVYVRAHLGESLSLVMIPLVLYFIERNIKKVHVGTIIAGAFSYALFIHSHSILSFIFTFIFFAYILFRSRLNKQLLFSSGLILALGLLLSFYFWGPALYEGRFINSKVFVSDWYKDHFLNFSNIIYSEWGFGSNVNDKGGLSAQIGPLHVIFVILSLLLLWKSKFRSFALFWLGVFAVGAFMSVSLSDFLWSRVHLLQQFQFPWRFTAVTCFAASVLAGYVLTYFKNKKLELVTIIVLLILSVPMARVLRYESLGEQYYFNYPDTAAYHNEATTIWVAGDAYEYPGERIEVISGEGNITNETRKTHLHTFTVEAETDVRIVDNTVYFPGWRVEVEGNKVPIEFQDINHRGLITFSVDEGKHDVVVKFGESPIRLFADLISLATLIAVALIFVFRKQISKLFKLKK